MTRKRCHRKPRPVRTVPIAFGFPASIKRDAIIEARWALARVSEHHDEPGAAGVDVAKLVRIALYCNEMCARLAAGDGAEADGLADAVEAVKTGADAAQSLAHAFADGIGRQATAQEAAALAAMVDAYEAIFGYATRRETTAAMSRAGLDN